MIRYMKMEYFIIVYLMSHRFSTEVLITYVFFPVSLFDVKQKVFVFCLLQGPTFLGV